MKMTWYFQTVKVLSSNLSWIISVGKQRWILAGFHVVVCIMHATLRELCFMQMTLELKQFVVYWVIPQLV